MAMTQKRLILKNRWQPFSYSLSTSILDYLAPIKPVQTKGTAHPTHKIVKNKCLLSHYVWGMGGGYFVTQQAQTDTADIKRKEQALFQGT